MNFQIHYVGERLSSWSILQKMNQEPYCPYFDKEICHALKKHDEAVRIESVAKGVFISLSLVFGAISLQTGNGWPFLAGMTFLFCVNSRCLCDSEETIQLEFEEQTIIEEIRTRRILWQNSIENDWNEEPGQLV